MCLLLFSLVMSFVTVLLIVAIPVISNCYCSLSFLLLVDIICLFDVNIINVDLL